MWRYLKNMFVRETADELRMHKLALARLQYLECEENREYYTAMSEVYKVRIARLEKEVLTCL